MKSIEVDRLREYFKYEPSTGTLVWTEREPKSDKVNKTFNARFANKECGYIYLGYRYVNFEHTNYLTHRVCFALHYGVWPDSRIDHIDGNRLNNKIENLREVSHTENMRNTKLSTKNKTGISGVMWDNKSNSWRVQIGNNGARITKIVDDFFEACCTRKRLEIELGYHLNHGRKM